MHGCTESTLNLPYTPVESRECRPLPEFTIGKWLGTPIKPLSAIGWKQQLYALSGEDEVLTNLAGQVMQTPILQSCVSSMP